MRLLDGTVYDTRELEAQQAMLGERIAETITLMNQLITTAAATAHDPDDYDRRYHQLEKRYQQLEVEHQQLTEKITDLHGRSAQTTKVRDLLETQRPLEYSDQAWNILVDYAKVTADGVIEVQFKA